jgi:hypothetical protein
MVKTYKIFMSLFFILACMNGHSMYAMTTDDAQTDVQTPEQLQNQKMFEKHIALYATCKASSRPEAREIINRYSFEALSFFVKNIKNQKVLNAIFQNIKSFPDRAIKLFFFCLDLQCRGLWDNKSMLGIEGFVQKLLQTSPQYDFRYITFKYNNLKEPILAVHDQKKEWMAPDIYDISLPHESWCTIL